MKIKNSASNRKTFFLLFASLLILISISLLLGTKVDEKKSSKNKVKPKLDIELRTVLDVEEHLIDIIKDNKGIISQDSVCRIHVFKYMGTPTLIYDYNDSLSFEERTDHFFLQIFLKDNSEWEKLSKSRYVPLDFNAKPFKVEIDGRIHFIYHRAISHELVELNNILKINTGRYKSGRGKSYAAYGLKLDNIANLEFPPSDDIANITITIKQKAFDKLKKKREGALHNGILITEDDDLVNVEVASLNTNALKAKMRLKGDWTDHLNDSIKWSYRLIMNDGFTVNGLRKFSLQHPKVRNYLWEWLLNKAMKENDLMGIKYDFMNVHLKVVNEDRVADIPIGIMAFEEAFDKILIENNSRREGIIMAFDESMIWNDRNRQRDLDLDVTQRNKNLQDFTNAPIKLYNENKVLANPKLAKQFKIAKNLLEGLQKGELKASEAFDVDKLTMFVALNNLFGGFHGFAGHNLKIYYNPITNLLEPISWDSDSGERITKIYNYQFTYKDKLYDEKLIEKLTLVSSKEFLNELINNNQDDLNRLTSNLRKEYPDVSLLDMSILVYNSNVIKKKIFPATALVTGFLDYNKNEINVKVKNVTEYPIEIINLVHNNGKVLTSENLDIVLSPNQERTVKFDLHQSFVNAFVSKKNKKGEFRFPKDLSKIKIQFNMLGQSYMRKEAIRPFGAQDNLDYNLQAYKKSKTPNLENFDFIKVNNKVKTIRLKKGNHLLQKTLIIPSGFSVIVERGFNLDMQDDASIISYSAFDCNATEKEPIKFFSSDSSGGGIFITNAIQTSTFNNCVFSNLSNPSSSVWELSGAVNFHETTVVIKNTTFEKNRCEDGLNIIRSNFVIDNSIFKNTFSDAFDGDFVEGKITNSEFINSGNDGVDVSGSRVSLENIYFENSSDKAISAGENSVIVGSEIHIKGGEIGIVSKDLSTVTLDNVTISDTRLAFSSFQKKSEFGPGNITITNLTTTNIESDYLIEMGSSLTIDDTVAATVSNKVIDQMYGKEYGKSSK